MDKSSTAPFVDRSPGRRMMHYQPLPRVDPPPFWRDDLLDFARGGILHIDVYVPGTREYGIIFSSITPEWSGPPAFGVTKLVIELSDAAAAEELYQRGMVIDFRDLIFASLREVDLERLVRDAKGLPTSPDLPLRETAVHGACAFDTSEALVGQIQPLFKVGQLVFEQGISPATISRMLVKACIGAIVVRYEQVEKDMQRLKDNAVRRNSGAR